MKREERKRKSVWKRRVLRIELLLLAGGILLLLAGGQGRHLLRKGAELWRKQTEGRKQVSGTAKRLPEEVSGETPREISSEWYKLLEKNPELYDFVQEYPNRAEYQAETVDLAEDTGIKQALEEGTVPLLMQWDLRWGYARYGEELVGLAGCGPTCLCMAYLFLTGDLSMNPADMAEFAWREGFYSEQGTDWSLWTLGAEKLGLEGEELGLDERGIQRALEEGNVVICSMRPGDFTTTGHFILLRGYDENGFYVNDPNRRSNSDRQWTFEELSGQIKNLWKIGIAL